MRVLYFLIPMLVSLILEFPLKKIALKLGLYAKENARTIHHGHIPRIGGVAIYIAFMVGCLLFVKENVTVKGVIIGGSIIFLEGLLDDAFDVKPIVKIIFQFAAATVLIFVGRVFLYRITLPFGITFRVNYLGYIITYLWIIGITNAVNLLDGLDGLAGGFSVIVLMTVAVLASIFNVHNSYLICTILAGATMGFLYHNFHPASIFMGDCGSQFLGFMIAAITVISFKSVTFITLGIPIILLFVPIFDTFSAIIRRKLAHKSISSPDKQHFHHILMRSLGQTGATLTIYIITAVFGFTAYLYIRNSAAGTLVLVLLIIIFEIFIEYTGMISNKYRPILNLLDKIARKHYKKAEETKSDE